MGGFYALDSLMGKGWDVKPLHADMGDCHFKFVTKLSIYLEKKHFTLKFFKAPFSMCPNYRDRCKVLLI